MGKRKRATTHDAKTGGRFALLPHEVINSPAYVALPIAAKALLMELLARFNGHNNGAIMLDQRTARNRLGISPRRVTDAFDALMQHGFIELSEEAIWSERRAREWRLTWLASALVV